MKTFKTIKDLDLNGKTILLRADLNVPKQDGKVTDTNRIDRLKPTIDYLREHGAKTLILSHFGRPKGARDTSLSLVFLTPVLETAWNCPVMFAQDCIGDNAKAMAGRMNNGDVALLENLRFHKGEKNNDSEFIKALSELGDIYINDAFSVSHRAHASTAGLATALPHAAGLLMEAELNALHSALNNPNRPVAAIVGGSKISTKLGVLNNLVKKVDALILGGGMANTFLYAQSANLGGSLYEADMKDQALQILETARAHQCNVILPVDFIAVTDIHSGAEQNIVPTTNIPDEQKAIDIGPETIKHLKEMLSTMKTVLWNGPMGVFEIKPFDNGTNEIAKHVAALTKSNTLISVAGGGDTVAALENAKSAKDFTYISTAGGAFLEWMEGRELPGVKSLYNQS